MSREISSPTRQEISTVFTIQQRLNLARRRLRGAARLARELQDTDFQLAILRRQTLRRFGRLFRRVRRDADGVQADLQAAKRLRRNEAEAASAAAAACWWLGVEL